MDDTNDSYEHFLCRTMPMLSVVLILFFSSVVELGLGVGLLSFVFCPLQKTAWPNRRKEAIFVALGVFLVSPSVAPAGSLAVMPLPLGVLIAFMRSSTDAMFLFKTGWFVVPSMLIMGLVCRYVARRFLSTQVVTAA